jgi:hypothetical protein
MARAWRALVGLAIVSAPAMVEGQALTRAVAARLLAADSLYDPHVNWSAARDYLEIQQTCATVTRASFHDDKEGMARAALWKSGVYTAVDTVTSFLNVEKGTKVCRLRVPDSVQNRLPTTEGARAARSNLLVKTVFGERQSEIVVALARIGLGQIDGVLQDPGSSTATVEFAGAWRATPYTAASGVDLSKFRTPRFTATFRRYDTGWRVTRVKFEGMVQR